MDSERVQVRAFALLVVLITLAGCSGTAADVVPTETGSAFVPGEVTDSTGAVEGVVVDTALQPLENATVQLLQANKEGSVVQETLSTVGGAFAFSLVSPGDYRVRAALEGFGFASRLVSIEAGTSSKVQLTLDETASTDPYLMTFIKSGYLSCSVAAVFFPTQNRCPGDEANGNSSIRFDVPEGFAFLVSESQWDAPGEELSQYFYARYRNETSGDNETRSVLDLWGPSILRSTFRPGELKAAVNPQTGALIVNAPVPTGAFNLTVTSYYAGRYADELDQTANPLCRPIYSRCAGVGATAGLRYQQFVSIFIFGVPEDVENYSAIPEG